MGVESFYLNIKVNKEQVEQFDNKAKTIPIFSEVINYLINENDSLFEINLNCAMVSFFPACELVYKVCSSLNDKSEIIIKTLAHEIQFKFNSFIDFFKWVYVAWEDKINYFNRDWGVFLINPNNYYKTRNKLKKKFYRKFY